MFLTKDDLQRVWRQLKRFAEYDDLKDLYKKVIPPLSEFEASVQMVEKRVNEFSEVLRRFDEILSKKVDKTYIKSLQLNNDDVIRIKEETLDLVNEFS